MSSERLQVKKTYKLFIGGGFPRSESGRSYEVSDVQGRWLANAVRASRKDLRDAVVAARKASASWAGLSAYNRGQVLYRVAEMMDARRAELAAEFAGWTDKIAQVLGASNPVAGPFFNLTVPEPIGVVGVIAPRAGGLLGLVERLAPALCGGNSVVALASERYPLPSIALAECLATADLPAGVVNTLTGFANELVPVLASHLDVDALDVTGLDSSEAADVERAAAGNVKRIVRAEPSPSPYEVTALMEMKTVWHPKGA